MAATVAATSALVLAAAKLVVGVLTGSLAVLAAAVDSLMDLACSTLNAYFLNVARHPPDAEHAFGHGKAEALSGVIQATIIAMGGVWLIVRSAIRLVEPEPVMRPLAGVTVVGLSFLVSLPLALFLRRAARRTGSVALHADAFHYVTDLATNLVAALALLGYELLGWRWLDPAASLVIAAYIIRSALEILRDAADELLDRGLPHDVEEDVQGLLEHFAPEVRGYRAFRSRRAGGAAFFEFRLLVERRTSFERTHEITEAVIEQIRERHGDGAQVMVDTDPV